MLLYALLEWVGSADRSGGRVRIALARAITLRRLRTALHVYMIQWNPKYVAPFVALVGLVVANNALWAYS